ncbi:restriction endonuclease subunit S [Salmonella enterica]|uniref:restriction endonuclease subunit S n=1 Tax=Salmonella enterica TaxID=28901 RepID=UPI0012752E54|nr:restriction endonuclease subunit S [Salmonella enterica]EBH8671325.1 restriction endonuclease subunit S [Salmonella enterica subsp. enterica serovar Lexington]ECD0363534.1 restriction endonuclease subunit S [Salmonella enterica subsp. enterica]EEJ9108647.1 restriction endonuclease subunit S [Salmonella enterica subsp. enterica serovar Lexington var. 15+]QVC48189.1 restriction endonuclease subunit S [Salmonella enterica subsp. enterica serovar Montevideo str. 4441 H]EAM8485660.1 restriction 
MECKSYFFGDLVEKWIDNRGKTPPLSETGIPLLEVKHLPETNLYPKIVGTKFVDEETYASWFRAYLEPNDILFSTVGTTARVVMTPQTETVAIAQNVLGIRFNKSIVDPWFMFYYMRGKRFQHDIEARLITTVQASIKRADMVGIPVLVPQLDIQKELVHRVINIDHKIQLNQIINQTLEQMAQALFKSWFVDFEPVKAKMAVLEAGGSQADATRAAMTTISGKDADALAFFEREHPAQYAELKATAELFPSAMKNSEVGAIPEGWNIGKLGDIIEFNPKRVLKKGNIAPYLDMKNVPITGHSAQEIIDREFSSGSKFRNGDTLLARITPCLENGKTAFVDFLLTDEMIGWGSTEFIIMRSKKSLPLSLSYFLARLDYFRTIAIQSMQGTSGRQRADASVLERHIWVVPPNEILKKFGIFSDSVLNCNRARNAENNALTELRDTLLPKLLSGEITLPEAEQIISEEA